MKRNIAVWARMPEVAHGWSVAVWSVEVAESEGATPEECLALARAAVGHHGETGAPAPDEWIGMRGSLGLSEVAERVPWTDIVMTQRWRQPPAVLSQQRAERLGVILQQCGDLVDACEFAGRGIPQREMMEVLIPELGRCLLSCSDEEREQAARDLPVFPETATKLLRHLREETGSLRELGELVGSDPTVAGHLVAAANSPLLGGCQPVKDLGEALGRVGVQLARQVVCGCAMRGVFEGPQAQRLWNHSLEVAERAAGLAAISGKVAVEQAFLAGLVHDIGKLALARIGRGWARYERLTQRGCEETVVDRVVYGGAHTAIAAEILERWRFEPGVVSAIEEHHSPERATSALAALLYLSEWAGEPPAAERERHRIAEERAGVNCNKASMKATPSSALSSLRFAA